MAGTCGKRSQVPAQNAQSIVITESPALGYLLGADLLDEDKKNFLLLDYPIPTITRGPEV